MSISPSPPPPPALRRARRPGAPALAPALDDTELAVAADALALGQWARVRTLLAGTGTDWDRRGHRLTVLAACPGSAAWAGDWQLAEPDSGDAATLLALATVRRALRGRTTTGDAAAACATAARMLPDDPTPWLGALLLARHAGTPDERAYAFHQIRARHPDHHHAHHLMTAALAEDRPEGTCGPHHPAHGFAARAAARAPADSPLALLPVVAHAERYRVRARAGLEPPTPRTPATGPPGTPTPSSGPPSTGGWNGRARAIPAASSMSTSSPTPRSTRGGWPRPPPSSSASARTPPARRGRTRAATRRARSGRPARPPWAGTTTGTTTGATPADDESLTPGPGHWPPGPRGVRIEG